MTIVSSKISEKRKDHVDHSKRFDYNIGSVPRRFIGTPDGVRNCVARLIELARREVE